MTPDEVRIVIKGWLENHSHLALQCSLLGFSVALRCIVTALTDFGVELSTGDEGRIAVGLWEEGTEFRYDEPRGFPELAESLELSAGQKIASSVTVVFPARTHCFSGERETVNFMELVD